MASGYRKDFTVSQLQRDALPQLKAPTTVPDIKGYQRDLERIWLDHMRQWVNRRMHPLENMPDYGREMWDLYRDTADDIGAKTQERRRGK